MCWFQMKMLHQYIGTAEGMHMAQILYMKVNQRHLISMFYQSLIKKNITQQPLKLEMDLSS